MTALDAPAPQAYFRWRTPLGISGLTVSGWSVLFYATASEAAAHVDGLALSACRFFEIHRFDIALPRPGSPADRAYDHHAVSSRFRHTSDCTHYEQGAPRDSASIWRYAG
jgi:hypothetical protein